MPLRRRSDPQFEEFKRNVDLVVCKLDDMTRQIVDQGVFTGDPDFSATIAVGQVELMLEEAKRMIRMRPDDPEAHAQMALMLESLGDHHSKRATYYDNEDDDERTAFVLRSIDTARGFLGQAVEARDVAIELSPVDAGSCIGKARPLIMLSILRGYEMEVLELEEEEDEDYLCNMTQLDVVRDLLLDAAAIEDDDELYFEIAEMLCEDLYLAYYSLGKSDISDALQAIDDGIEILDCMLDRNPENRSALDLKAETLEKRIVVFGADPESCNVVMGDYEELVRLCERIRGLGWDVGNARRLAHARKMLGDMTVLQDVDAAAAVYETAIKDFGYYDAQLARSVQHGIISPEQYRVEKYEICMNIGGLCGNIGKHEKAIEAYAKAHELAEKYGSSDLPKSEAGWRRYRALNAQREAFIELGMELEGALKLGEIEALIKSDRSLAKRIMRDNEG